MAWTCPSCGFNGNEDFSIRCTCGHELQIKKITNYNKIGGGLYLVILGLLITPIYYLIDFSKRLEDGKVYLGLETFLIIICVVIPIVLLFLLFAKKRIFPKLIIAYLLFGICLGWTNYFLIKSMTSLQNYYAYLNHSIDVAVLSTVFSIPWIVYFKISNRSKKTFIR